MKKIVKKKMKPYYKWNVATIWKKDVQLYAIRVLNVSKPQSFMKYYDTRDCIFTTSVLRYLKNDWRLASLALDCANWNRNLSTSVSLLNCSFSSSIIYNMIVKIQDSPIQYKRYRVWMDDGKHYDFGLDGGDTYIDHHDVLKD